VADTLPPLAKVEDLVARLGREIDSDTDVDRATAVIEDASEFVREEGHQTWVSPDDPTVLTAPRVVRVITIRVAERAFRNPEGYSSEAAGDYSYQRNGAVGEGGMYLTERELKIIRRAAGRTGLWIQATTRGDLHASNTAWMEDSFGFEMFPVDTYDC
jgi:hypothetical protein